MQHISTSSPLLTYTLDSRISSEIRRFRRNNRQNEVAEPPRLRGRMVAKKSPIKALFCSATRDSRISSEIRRFRRNNRQNEVAENPRLRGRMVAKKSPIKALFCSATRTRTGVYGVRGRCPRPLDDSTRSGLPSNGRSGLRPKGLQHALSQFDLCQKGYEHLLRTEIDDKSTAFFSYDQII